ncbi:ribulose bisphosphate carboxylase/oxygenase activase, chloroplastic isoform X1 [Benincasa hispida]|uniref:ribulose bisphosphate carboxylase/oxygenase activase, chloroplastic isoform X1 n=1 Tax=Benincasa hispida TaxID=102211 RepID=UPI001901E477|nr:ribulose bisphosphate carboxylase/oxygenase activase, chloroplastic isoform X1 [Benincasa hispida]XP_038901351.1 ribulose bisphosphate carboxylase/oxygenase activase, chloroplastic isoform X1 [Benincasa hispida]
MAATVSTVGAVNRTTLNNSNYGGLVPNSAFLGSRLKASSRFTTSKMVIGNFKIVAEHDEEKQTEKDKWRGLAFDTSDDQQDITRGKGLADPLFQAPMGTGTHNAVMSSYEYISAGLREYNFDNSVDGFYIAPAFMDKLMVHIVKNFLNLPNIKVPLILGIWGGKGQGKSFQCELVFAKMGINPIMMSAGELESGNAGEPAKLLRQRYREAADIIKKGKMCCLFINDLDAGAGRLGGTTQYTVNNQMVNATLMNIADNPTNVQLPGMYNKEENPRVPIIVTGNDFSTLYAPLIRDGRMDKFYWAPTREDRIGICTGIFRTDDVPIEDIVKLVDTFPGQSIDFFGALRARVYDDEVRKWAVGVGVESIGRNLVNSKEGPPTFDQPKMTLEKLLEYGNMLIMEQENVKRVKLADKYLNEAALGDANVDVVQFETSQEAALEVANEDVVQSETSNEVALEDANEDVESGTPNAALENANEDTVEALIDTNEEVVQPETSYEVPLGNTNEDAVQSKTSNEVAVDDATEDVVQAGTSESALVDANEDVVQSGTSNETATIDANKDVVVQSGTSYESMGEEERNKLISLFLKAVQIHLLKTMSQQPDSTTKASSIDS